MGVTQYTGARYVPLFADPEEWNNVRTYEPLTIVLHEGNSFTSKQFVPKGIDINNAEFWAETGNYNAQIEAYRNSVVELSDKVDELSDEIDDFEGKTELFNLKSVQLIETAIPVYREINFDTTDGYENMQGGAVYTVNGTEYYSFICGTDSARKLKTIRISNMAVVNEIDVPAGHFGSICFQNGKLYLCNYTQSAATYGSIFVYDVSNPANISLIETKRFDTSYGVTGVASYKGNMLIFEGAPFTPRSEYQGIYTYNLDNGAIQHMFDFNQYISGNRPQPGSYDPVFDCFVSPTSDNASLSYFDMTGNLITTVHLKDEYNFISIGELENITPMGNVIYFAGYFYSHLRDSTSFTLFKFNAQENTGKTDYVQEAFQTFFNVNIDRNSNNLIPNFISGETMTVLYPPDAINVIEYLTKNGVRNCTIRLYGDYECGLFIENVNCAINTFNGYFARGIFIADSNIEFLETRDAGFIKALENPTAINGTNKGTYKTIAEVDKPCYITMANCMVTFDAYTQGIANDEELAIYGLRLINCFANFIGTAVLRNVIFQNSNVFANEKNLNYFKAIRSNIKCGLIYADNSEYVETRFDCTVQGIRNPGAEVTLKTLSAGVIKLQILKNGVRAFECSHYIATTFTNASFMFEDKTFTLNYNRDTGVLTMPNVEGYTYALRLV